MQFIVLTLKIDNTLRRFNVSNITDYGQIAGNETVVCQPGDENYYYVLESPEQIDALIEKAGGSITK